MKLQLQKTIHGFIPADPTTEEYSKKIKMGSILHGDFTKARNPQFLKKFFALLNIAFDQWEPGELNDQYGVVEKNFEQMREDLTILAGYFERSFRVDGTVRVKAKSISFAKMEEPEFEKLYQAVLTVIIEKIMYNSSREEVDEMVLNSILEFC